MSKTLRRRFHNIMAGHNEPGESHRVFEYFLMALICINVVAVMLETVPGLSSEVLTIFAIIEATSVAIFTVEYLLRVWIAVEQKHATDSNFAARIKYLFSPMAIIDLIAILPFYLSMFISIDLRVLRLFRLTRLIKLGRYSRSMQMLLGVLRRELRVLIAALSVLLIIMVVAATGIYYLEQDVQPEAFGSIPASLWWALVTLTTVGYGDVVPITAAGKVFGGLIIILGVGIFALPAAILASSFTDQLHIRRAKFRKEALSAIADGKISHHEASKLNHLRDVLDLDKEEVELVIKLFSNQQSAPASCPHCGKDLHSPPIKK